MEAFDILKNSYNKEISNKILESYKEIESNYVFGKWKTSELDAGHFVESVRRLIEQELLGSYTPFNKHLTRFNDSVLTQYAQASGHKSFRILIPLLLRAIYDIRNNRGVGHISSVSPNQMDATYIFYAVKWILAEIIRIKSAFSIDETQDIISKIIERKLDIIWKGDGFTRILYNDLKTEQKILVLLYDRSPQNIKELQISINYKNITDLKIKLFSMNEEVLINFDGKNCTISPKGIAEAEKIILKVQ